MQQPLALMNTPLVPLEELRVAATDGGGLHIEAGRCQSDLTLHLGDFARCLDFLEEALKLLHPGLFFQVQQSPKDTSFQYDAYGLYLSDDIAGRFGLTTRRSWYFGFRVVGKRSGRRVLTVTAHPLHKNMRTNDGTLILAGR